MTTILELVKDLERVCLDFEGTRGTSNQIYFLADELKTNLDSGTEVSLGRLNLLPVYATFDNLHHKGYHYLELATAFSYFFLEEPSMGELVNSMGWDKWQESKSKIFSFSSRIKSPITEPLNSGALVQQYLLDFLKLHEKAWKLGTNLESVNCIKKCFTPSSYYLAYLNRLTEETEDKKMIR